MAQSKIKQKEVPPMPESAKAKAKELGLILPAPEPVQDPFWQMNILLQKKKNVLRKALSEKLKVKEPETLTEAAVKKLFTELLAESGLELKFEVGNFESFTGGANQIVGRIVHFDFILYDIETGFSEATAIAVEGADKGSRTGDKTYWNALKYYLGNTFLIAIEEDSEDEAFYKSEIKATISQIAELKKIYTGDNLSKLLATNKIDKIEDLPFDTASNILEQLKKGVNNE